MRGYRLRVGQVIVVSRFYLPDMEVRVTVDGVEIPRFSIFEPHPSTLAFSLPAVDLDSLEDLMNKVAKQKEDSEVLNEPDDITSIHGGLVLQDDECLVAIAEDGNAYIIARSDWLQSRDVLVEDTAEDCNFDSGWDTSLTVGLYKLSVKAWADNWGEGDDAGVTVNACTPLWTPSIIEAGFEGAEWLDARHGDLILNPGETMEWLLKTRRGRLWRVEDRQDSHPRGKVLLVHHDGKWIPVAFTDLNDHISRVITGPSPIDRMRRGVLYEQFWADPIAYLAKVWYWGVRYDGNTIYLVDSESDG